jgi:AcrR family transcriptional regulator
MLPRATPHPALAAPHALIRDWRDAAAEHALEALLPSVGCGGLTADGIAAAIGVAQGSVSLRWPDIERLMGKLLDRWATQVAPDRDLEAQEHSIAQSVCHLLFAPVESAGGVRPAIPCCLATSPCPHGWNARWDGLAASLGLGSGAIAQVIGEAVQAIASSPTVRELITDGRFEEAAAVVAMVIEGAGANEDDELDES